MNVRRLFAVCALMLGMISAGFAQGDKIGFVNLEGVMSLMPEYNAMLKSMQIYEKKLSDQLQIKQNYLEQKIQEYVQAKQNGAVEADLTSREGEVKKLDAEIKKAAAEAEQKIGRRRVEKLTPIMDRLKLTIDELAKAGGYTYVLNSMDGTQTSVVLNASDDNDLTKAVLDKLGIDYSNN